MILPMEMKISRDSWHYRLQSDIFGRQPTFHNFCPYFWLTIFCLAIAPFSYGLVYTKLFFTEYLPPRLEAFEAKVTPYVKWIGWLFEKAIGGLLWVIDATLCEPLDNYTINHATDDQVLSWYSRSRDHFAKTYNETLDAGLKHLLWYATDRDEKKKFVRTDEKFQKWKETAGPDWEAKLNEAIKRREDLAQMNRDREAADQAAEYDRKKAAESAAVARRQMLNNIVKWTQYVVKGAGILLGLVVAWYLIKLLLWIPWAAIFWGIVAIPVAVCGGVVVLWKAKWYIIGGFAALGATLFLAGLLGKLIRKCDLDVDLEPSLGPIFRAMVRFVRAIVNPFVSFFKFVVEYVKVFKQNNCPQIQWVD